MKGSGWALCSLLFGCSALTPSRGGGFDVTFGDSHEDSQSEVRWLALLLGRGHLGEWQDSSRRGVYRTACRLLNVLQGF